MNRYINFAKNMGIKAAALACAGMGASCLAGNFYDDGRAIGFAAGVSQYLTGLSVFGFLHTKDNREHYSSDDGLDWRKVLGDNLKFAACSLPIDAVIISTRPFVQNFFIENGNSAGNSSLYTDTCYAPFALLMSMLIAMGTGLIKKKKGLEEIVSGGGD